MILEELGWRQEWGDPEKAGGSDEAGLVVGRVAVSYGSLGTAWTEHGPLDFSVAGRMRLAKEAQLTGLPVTGDWVAMRPSVSTHDRARIEAILPRHTAFLRKIAGNARKAQAVAANMDTIFIVSSMNRDFNIRRLERYLALTRESGAQPVLVLTKLDVADNDESYYQHEARTLDASLPVHCVSAPTGQNMSQLDQYLVPAKTVALLGSSGVGKSTIINYMLGEDRLRTAETRGDDRGRHTTTNRELLVLPGGALVIDTPGMRELQMLDQNEGVADAFDDIRELAFECKFGNCGHNLEPGCAVRFAVEEGKLTAARLESFRKLQAELADMATEARNRPSVRLDKKTPRSERPVIRKDPNKK